jgi:flavin-binding protein dodecin
MKFALALPPNMFGFLESGLTALPYGPDQRGRGAIKAGSRGHVAAGECGRLTAFAGIFARATSVRVTVHPPTGERDHMTDHTYRVIEIVGSSPDGIEAAIRNAVSRAAETMRGLDWFEMQSVRGHLENGAIAHFQVTLKVGFRLEEAK